MVSKTPPDQSSPDPVLRTPLEQSHFTSAEMASGVLEPRWSKMLPGISCFWEKSRAIQCTCIGAIKIISMWNRQLNKNKRDQEYIKLQFYSSKP
jgi:hypothetical protein